MYKLRPFLPLKVMENVYYSLIYSHIILYMQLKHGGQLAKKGYETYDI